MFFTLMDMVFPQGLEWTKELRTMMLLCTCSLILRGDLQQNPLYLAKVYTTSTLSAFGEIYSKGTYYYLFYHLEDIGLLNPLDEEDLFSFVFLDIINQHLSLWMHSWNNHKMSSCNGKTPIQMWIEGWQRMRKQPHSGSGNVHWSNCK